MRRSSLMIAVLVLLALGLSTAAFAEIGRWPISNSSANTADVLTSAYGPRYVSPTRPYDVHEGVDIRAQTPLPVYPWKSGTIEYLGGSENGTGGWWVKVTHPENGFRTGYYHLTYDELYRNLKKWDPVSQGTAFVNSGESGGVIPHLHFNYLLGSVSNPPDNPGQDVLDNARNPMQILSYDNDSGPWTYGGTLYLSGDYITACSFTVQTGGAELDLDRVEVEVLHPFYDNVVIDISQRSNVYDTWGAGDGEFYATTDNGLQMRVLIDPDEFSDSQTGDQTINFLFNIADAWPNVPSSSNSLIATAYDLGGRHERVIWETGVNREIVNFTATGGYQQVTLNWDAYDFDPNIWFNIYRSIDGGVSYPDSMGSVQYRGDGSYSFVDNTVEYDYEYRYMIEDTEGPGWWGPVSASPTGGVSTPPAPSPPPTIYMADTGFETISIHLLGGSDYASSYQIGYDPDGAEPYEHSDYFTGSTHDLRNLSNGLRYYIAVRGINASGSSGYSNQVNAIPEGRHPAQNLSFEQISGENIDYWYPYGSGTFGSSTVSRDGSRSAYLSSSSGSGYFGFNQRYIAVQPNTTYYLGVWVKTQGVTSG
ncbi:MAG TPA: M23 family metallopeptidase, partial [Candidatus Latescibacteria bacterium]|nr:M23 family metallopeptidase [Candidatus Latescibacterota bacterium]